MNLTQRQLRMFVTTAAVGNISRASEALHISQPALTRALQEFESQLGVALFLRTTRQLGLTPEGERFLPVAQRLLHDLAEAAALIQGEATGQRGSVSLAVGEAFGCTVLPDILHAFVKTHPGVRVRVVNDNSQGITCRVAQGEVDFGIGSPVGRTEALRFTKLLSAPLGLLFNPELHQLKAWVRTEKPWATYPCSRKAVTPASSACCAPRALTWWHTWTLGWRSPASPCNWQWRGLAWALR